MRTAILVLCLTAAAPAQVATDLWRNGYSVIPTPRTVGLAGDPVRIDETWSIDPGPGGMPARSLIGDLQSFHGLALRGGPARAIRLRVAAGTVKTREEPGVDRQAYRISLSANLIEVTGNAEPGLFYGVQTLLQLIRREDSGLLTVPAGVIEDWPRLQLRFMHWDTKHHQDRMATLKTYLDWAARFKMNMIGFELEDKFEYPSNPVIGAPGAFTTAQLQEIVNYGLERHIQVIPVIQAPAHMAYVLKHPQFAHLRADGNNYQSAMCDPRSTELIFQMYDDVIKATKGVDYFYVSTDEVYYAGIEATCRPYNDRNRSLAWIEFAKKARDFLAQRGRRMLAWVEYPVLPEHIPMLPPDLIDGVIGEEEYLEHENKMGMRQIAYFSTQGAEFLFPNHLGWESPSGYQRSRVQQAYESFTSGRHTRGKPIGAFAAAWSDSGLHSETFWLGWSTVAQYAWNPGAAPPEQHAAEFFRYYYGPRATGMAGVYRAMQRQSRAWESSWDRVTSRVRKPGYGNSYGPKIGTERRDLTLSPPPLPSLPDLRFEPWPSAKHAEEARRRMLESEQLITDLQSNLALASRNRYNLEVFLSLARFMGHHWRLITAMAAAEQAMNRARQSAKPEEAVGYLVGAHGQVDGVRKSGQKIFADLTAVWEKSRFPKGQSVNGRAFVHVLDDTKDHWADRTPDLGYMMQPERGIGLEKWLNDLAKVIQAYAKAHNVPVKGLGEARLEE